MFAIQRLWICVSSATCGIALAEGPSERLYTRNEIENLVILDGDAYREARDDLLARGAAEFEQTQGLGSVVAFILRHRLAASDAFAVWDAIEPQQARSGIAYFRTGSPDPAGLAFLLEQAWKADSVPIRRIAAEEYFSWVRRGIVPELPVDAAVALSTSGPSRDLRLIGYLALGAARDPAAESLVRSHLGARDLDSAYKDMVLVGLYVINADYAASAVMDSLDSLTHSSQLVGSATAILARADGAAPRSTLHRLIEDPAAHEFQRLVAIEACADFPRDGDGAAIQRFLQGDVEPNLKERAILKLASYPYAVAAPLLRSSIPADYLGPVELNAAVFTIGKLYSRDPAVPLEDAELDALSLERILERADVAPATKTQAAKVIGEIKRQVKIRSSSADE